MVVNYNCRCGAVYPATLNSCPECGYSQHPSAESSTESSTSSAPTTNIRLSEPTQFGIKSMLLTVTLIAASLGLLRLIPGAGFVLVIVLIPAFARAMVLTTRAKLSGRRLTVPEKIVRFLASLGLVFSVVLSCGMAFFITCWGGYCVSVFAYRMFGVTGWDNLNWSIGTGIVVGIIGQVIFLIFFIVWLWRRRQQQLNRLGDIGFVLAWGGFITVTAGGIFNLTDNVDAVDFAPWGFVALPGLIFSLIAFRKPQRVLACAGIGLGLASCTVSVGIMFAYALGVMSRENVAGMNVVLLSSVVGGGILAGVVSTTAFYVAQRRAIRRMNKSTGLTGDS